MNDLTWIVTWLDKEVIQKCGGNLPALMIDTDSPAHLRAGIPNAYAQFRAEMTGISMPEYKEIAHVEPSVMGPYLTREYAIDVWKVISRQIGASYCRFVPVGEDPHPLDTRETKAINTN